MANTEHADILSRGVEAWNNWREAHPNVRPDLNEIHLEDIDLTGIDLQESDLYQATMKRCKLRIANLRGTDLRDSDLSETDFSEADLSGASLHMADLHGAGMQIAALQWANLIGADLTKTNLVGVVLTDADLTQADLSEALLTGANLQAANLTGAKLVGAGLNGAKLQDAVLVGADLTGADFTDVDLSGANVSEVKYDRFRMRGNFHGIRADTCQGNPRFRQDAREQSYIDTLEKLPRSPVKKKMWNVWAFFDYGRSISRLLLSAATVVFMFGLLFWIDWISGMGFLNFEASADSWLSPWFYSVSTFTLVGSTQISPGHWIGEGLVLLESICGYMTLGFSLAMVAKILARKV